MLYSPFVLSVFSLDLSLSFAAHVPVALNDLVLYLGCGQWTTWSQNFVVIGRLFFCHCFLLCLHLICFYYRLFVIASSFQIIFVQKAYTLNNSVFSIYHQFLMKPFTIELSSTIPRWATWTPKRQNRRRFDIWLFEWKIHLLSLAPGLLVTAQTILNICRPFRRLSVGRGNRKPQSRPRNRKKSQLNPIRAQSAGKNKRMQICLGPD